MTPLDREEIKSYLGENETQINESISDAKNEILAKIDETAESSGSGAAPSGVQEFTTSGTFTVPEGVHKIWVTACGGGGGGAGGCNSNSASKGSGGGGGGGGGCIYKKRYIVTPGKSIFITIGEGGNGGAVPTNYYSDGSPGLNGGATVIGDLVTLPGGEGGKSGNNDKELAGYGGAGGINAGGGGAGNAGGKGAGATGGGGGLGLYSVVEFQGYGATKSGGNGSAPKEGITAASKGGNGSALSNVPLNGGGGGGGSLGFFGGDGGTGDKATPTVPANAFGGGGGGGGGAGYTNKIYAQAGAKGGNGYCLIEW